MTFPVVDWKPGFSHESLLCDLTRLDGTLRATPAHCGTRLSHYPFWRNTLTDSRKIGEGGLPFAKTTCRGLGDAHAVVCCGLFAPSAL